MTEKTVLPLSPLDMIDFFKEKDRVFVIDYEQSKKTMTPKSILIYLSNLQITCDFDTIDAELVSEYLYLKDLCNIEELDLFVANLCYFRKYGKPFYDTKSFAECGVEVLENNQEIITFFCQLFESSSLFLLSKEFTDYEQNEEGEMPEKVGFCFLNLYNIPDFLVAYLETMKPLEDQLYFSDYFNDDNYNFKGRNLFSFFATKDNMFYQYLVNLRRLLDLKDNVNEENVDALDRLTDVYDILND